MAKTIRAVMHRMMPGGQLISAFTLIIVGIPVLIGFAFTLLLALSNGWNSPSNFAAIPIAVALSLWTAWGSTLIAFWLAICLGFWIQRSVAVKALGAVLPGLLAVPHAAFAIGFAFLISPSGWLARLVSPWLSGWDRPPDLGTVQDPMGIALMLGLAVKETPFLLLTLLAALGQTNYRQTSWLGASLGYSQWRSWISLTVPQLYLQLRLPLFVVLVYGLSVVDMAKVLGPNIPPTLAVMSTSYLNNPDPTYWPIGAALGLLLLLLALLSIGLARLIELKGGRLYKKSILSGRRGSNVLISALAVLSPLLWGLIILASIVLIGLWSFTWRWKFPDALPMQWSLELWIRNAELVITPLWHTLSIACASTAVSLIASIALLEFTPNLSKLQFSILYAPLILPQLAFLFGVQWLLLKIGIDGLWWALVWVHALFVFPYMVIGLAGPWRAYDTRYNRIGWSLGQSRWSVWWKVKRPLLLRPLSYASALGFSVSVAQYLSTLFVGSGRYPTLTTEAIALSSGGDRRMVAVLAFLQMLLPVLAFALAFALPNLRFRHFKDM